MSHYYHLHTKLFVLIFIDATAFNPKGIKMILANRFFYISHQMQTNFYFILCHFILKQNKFTILLQNLVKNLLISYNKKIGVFPF